MAGDAVPLRIAADTEPQAPLPPESTPGVDVGYACQIDERRSLSMRTMFAQDTPAPEQERILARVVAVAAVTGLRERLIEFKRDKGNAEAQLARLASDPKRRSEIKVQIDALNTQSLSRFDEMERAFHGSGRQGKFAPAGRDKTELGGIARDVERLEKELSDLEEGLANQKRQLAEAIGNWEVAIANAEREIQIRREAYGG